eukprot:Hpha_TRINITY_DN7849_c0_g2::TRINITY_DN7849_c0_g2_i1::g.185625::m.185625
MGRWAVAASVLCAVLAEGVSLGDRLTMGIWRQEAQPTQQSDAAAKGYAEVPTDGKLGCNRLYGHRYQQGGRLTPTLMYTNNGRLAGFQVVVDTDDFPMYPLTNLRTPTILPLSGTQQAMSLYFIDPALLCNDTTAPTNESVGDRLWIRQATSASERPDFEPIPLSERDAVAASSITGFSPGGCAASGFAYKGSPGMGRHYWRFLDADTPCNVAGPLFLLYADGKLSALGFTYVGLNEQVPTTNGTRPVRDPQTGRWIMNNSEVWEFAQQPLYPFFFDKDNMPTCLDDLNTWNSTKTYGTVTTGTLHVFVSDPYTIKCSEAPAACATPQPATSPPALPPPADDDDDSSAWVFVGLLLFLVVVLVAALVILRSKANAHKSAAGFADQQQGVPLTAS